MFSVLFVILFGLGFGLGMVDQNVLGALSLFAAIGCGVIHILLQPKRRKLQWDNLDKAMRHATKRQRMSTYVNRKK